jgi:long-chain acyl-CoA synthetase
MLAAWANLPHATKPSTLRWVLSAGAPLPDELALRAEACLGVEVRQGYGMTEATFASVNAPPDARVIGSVGKPSPGVELRVIDDAGNEVAPGESGEVCVRGQNVMTRYLHDPEASADALRDGWMHSGDVGRIDADGRLWIVDRIKDLVIRGGYNVYPSEVEDALARHPDVAEVAVIGRPDAMYGEEVVAVIVPRAGCSVDLAGLAALARARLSRTKWPREYAVIERMPLGASGKIQKRELRAWLQHGKLAVVAAPSA